MTSAESRRQSLEQFALLQRQRIELADSQAVADARVAEVLAQRVRAVDTQAGRVTVTLFDPVLVQAEAVIAGREASSERRRELLQSRPSRQNLRAIARDLAKEAAASKAGKA